MRRKNRKSSRKISSSSNRLLIQRIQKIQRTQLKCSQVRIKRKKIRLNNLRKIKRLEKVEIAPQVSLILATGLQLSLILATGQQVKLILVIALRVKQLFIRRTIPLPKALELKVESKVLRVKFLLLKNKLRNKMTTSAYQKILRRSLSLSKPFHLNKKKPLLS